MSTEPIKEKKPNRLIHEKSPYLLQHAHNPVDWYPWSDEAFAKAKGEDKPVFVSIGYSTCHWCHVMEKECFDDDEVAKLMNEAFVSIKVDREERPDLDGAYMAMCQVMGRNCGWPLNIIMTPDKNVFFVASYIPKSSKFGSVGMMDFIPQIREAWLARRFELETIGEDIKRRIQTLENRSPAGMPGLKVLDDAYQKLAIRFDEEHGGFGNAPKFPTPHNLIFLLRYWYRTNTPDALSMVKKTLRSMRLGGIFDHLGFGFHRYSTDARWLVPHFEKMLYDQALLALANLEAYQATEADEFRITADEVLEYVMRSLASPEGGFYSAEDADSEGEEGKFYLWAETEIREALSLDDAELAVKLFGVEAQGNFEAPRGEHTGKNILHLPKPLEDLASDFQLPVDTLTTRLDRIRRKLYEARERRPHPAKDTKILTDWNGLMISALARASQVLYEEKYLKAAIETANFFLKKMKDKSGTLYHRYAKDERAVEGFLDDYAFFVFGLIEIYEASFDSGFLKAAIELTDKMVALFWDEKNRGFFFTSKDKVDIVLRRKETYDGALPSGNSMALLNLLRLTRLSENSRYEEIAQLLISAFSSEMQESPSAHTFMLNGLDFFIGPVSSVTLVGDLNEQNTKNLLRTLSSNYLPRNLVLLKTPSKSGPGYEQINGKATAYVCRGQICLPPANEPKVMLDLLKMAPTSR